MYAARTIQARCFGDSAVLRIDRHSATAWEDAQGELGVTGVGLKLQPVEDVQELAEDDEAAPTVVAKPAAAAPALTATAVTVVATAVALPAAVPPATVPPATAALAVPPATAPLAGDDTRPAASSSPHGLPGSSVRTPLVTWRVTVPDLSSSSVPLAAAEG